MSLLGEQSLSSRRVPAECLLLRLLVLPAGGARHLIATDGMRDQDAQQRMLASNVNAASSPLDQFSVAMWPPGLLYKVGAQYKGAGNMAAAAALTPTYNSLGQLCAAAAAAAQADVYISENDNVTATAFVDMITRIFAQQRSRKPLAPRAITTVRDNSSTTATSASASDILGEFEELCSAASTWTKQCKRKVKIGGVSLGTVCELANVATGGILKAVEAATKLCSCIGILRDTVAAAPDLFDEGSLGSFEGVSVQAMKILGDAAACMIRQGVNMRNNSAEIINTRMQELNQGGPCGGTCVNDPTSFWGRPAGAGETFDCDIISNGAECQCWWSVQYTTDQEQYIATGSTKWTCPAPRPWRIVRGRDIDLSE